MTSFWRNFVAEAVYAFTKPYQSVICIHFPAMDLFLISLVVLIGGYFVYGLIVEKIIGINPSRPTPATSHADGVDYIPLPAWRIFLIQFLNIAGVGPIFGAIMGVMYGPAAFLWIVFGTIFAGGVHDFVSAHMSLRENGLSLPEIVGRELGPIVKTVMRMFSVVLLMLVVAVFVKTPAGLLATMTGIDIWVWIGAIFIYYMLATILPIDKLIGKIYPLFGAALLFMGLGLLYYLFFGDVQIAHGLSEGLDSRFADSSHSVFPMMFVSIACGAISGFHATQSPMMARCITNERLARPIFYGAMVAEGLIALIWAAAAIAFTGSYDGLASYMAEHNNNAGALVNDISFTWLGAFGGVLAIIGVVAAPITTGDTALRSARLISADFLRLDQKPIAKRFMVSIPLFAVCLTLLFINFDVLWRYFAWSNQTLSVFTLWAATVWLARRGRIYLITLAPAMFMTMVTVSYICFAPSPEGFGLDLFTATGIAGAIAVIFLCLFLKWRLRLVPSARISPKA